MSNTNENTDMPIFFPENFRYECAGCGVCCLNDWNVHVDPRTYERLTETEFYEKMKTETGLDDLFILYPEISECHMVKVNDMCPMLDGPWCKIHAELGLDYKPMGCRQFPFFIHPTPDGIFVAVSFMCKSVRDNTGQPLEKYLKDIRGFMSEYRFEKLGENIAIADNVQIDWEGYKILESLLLNKLNEKQGIGQAFFDVFMQLVMILVKCQMDSIEKIGTKGLEYILGDPMELPFTRDEMFCQQEVHFGLMLVSLFEGIEPAKRTINIDEIMTDGNIRSRLFKQSINIEALWNYARANPCPWKDEEFLRYARHLIWQKYLLQKKTVLNGILALNLLYPFFDWFMYCSAFTRGAEKPEVEDARFALSVLEMAVKHDNMGYVESLARLFRDSLVKQVMIYVNDYVPEDCPST
jgi:Fe-S-cluster containining protein